MSEKATFDKIKYGSCKCDKGNTARGQHKCPYKFILFKTETICTCCFECENECLYDLSSELLSIIEGRENCEK